jgi:hypothetical protein
MSTPTYTLIDSLTTSSNSTSVAFSGIAAGGDLVLVTNTFAGTNTNVVYLRFNNDAGTNYRLMAISGNGSSALATDDFNATAIKISPKSEAFAGDRMLTITNVIDFSASDKNKTIIARSNNAAVGTDLVVGRWGSNSVITSVTFFTPSGVFLSGSTFHLYEIAKAL